MVLSLLVTAAFLVAFALVMPPMQVCDEDAHFIRAYDVFRRFVGDPKPYAPADILDFVSAFPTEYRYWRKSTFRQSMRALWIMRHPSSRQNTAIESTPSNPSLKWGVISTSLYFPISYLPAALGIWIADVTHLPAGAMFYTGRLMNCLAFLFALWLAIRLAPDHLISLFAIAWIPMSLHQVASFSADAITITLCLLLVAAVLRTRVSQVNVTYLCLVLVLVTMCSLSKSSIWILPVIGLIPVANFRSRRSQILYFMTTTACVLAAQLFWHHLTAENLEAMRLIRFTRGIDIKANLAFFRQHPLMLPWIVARDCAVLGHDYVGHLIAAFGWSMTPPPAGMRKAYILILLLATQLERRNNPLRMTERGILLSVMVGGLSMIHMFLYLSDAVVRGNNIFTLPPGVQGRYFIPLVLPGLLATQQTHLSVRSSRLLLGVIGAALVCNLVSLHTIYRIYYN